MCVHFTRQHLKRLQKDRAHFECGVFMKDYRIVKDKTEDGWGKYYVPYYRYTSKSYLPGKVYFDDRTELLESRKWCGYKTGYHAWLLKKSLFSRSVDEGGGNYISFPVMLADITAIDSMQVCGRVKLIMTEKDYETYKKDIKTKPISIENGEIELKPAHV